MAIEKYDLIIENDFDDKDSSLVLMKFPAMRSQFENPPDIVRINLKPKSFKAKLEVIVESNCNNYCEATAAQMGAKSTPKSFPNDKIDRNIYTSTRTSVDDGQLFVAKLINNKLVCRPVTEQLTFRSDFSHFDLKDEVDPKEEIKPISVKFASADRQANASFGGKSKFGGGNFSSMNNNPVIRGQQLEAEDPDDEYQLLRYKPFLSREATLQRETLFGKPMPKIKQDPDAEEMIDRKPKIELLHDIKPKIERMDDIYTIKQEVLEQSASLQEPSQNVANKKTANLIKQRVKDCLLKAKIVSYEEIHQYLKGYGLESNRINQLNNKEILDALNELAVLVQGNWAIKSEILYGDSSERESTDVTGISIKLFTNARDYLLWLFTQSRTVNRLEYSRAVKMPDHDILELFNQLARFKHDTKRWEIKLPTDNRFVEQFPDIVTRQNTFWKVRRANKLAIYK